MMRSMRAATRWVMVIVAIAFGGWGIFEVGMNVTGQNTSLSSEVGRVNGKKIDQQTFYTAVRRAQEQQRLAGAPVLVTLEEQRALEDAVFEQLVQDLLLLQEYRKRRISVSDDEIRQALLNAPPQDLREVSEFQTDGEFDIEKYQRYLRSGVDPTLALAIEARYRSEIPRFKLFERITEDVYVPTRKLWTLYRDQRDSVTARIVALLPQSVASDSAVEPTDEELRAYYRTHRDNFRREARAYVSYVSVSRLASAEDTTTALQRAQQIRQELLDGADFAAVAARESADSANRDLGGDLGDVGRGDFVPEFERAAAALAAGEISEPVLTLFGYHIIKLDSRNGDRYHARHILIPIEQSGNRLDVSDALADTLDIVAAEQDDPSVLDEVADQLGLPIHSGEVVKGSRMQLGRFQIPDVNLWALEAEVGETSLVIEADHAYYVFRLDSLASEGVPALDDVRPSVVQEVIREKKLELARGVAADIAAAVRNGSTLEEAANAEGLQVRNVGPFTRVEPAPFLRDVPEAIGLAFGLPIGSVGGPVETGLAIFLIEPIQRTVADSAVFVEEADGLRMEYLNNARRARVQLILASMREKASVLDRRRDVERAQRDLQDSPLPLQQRGRTGF